MMRSALGVLGVLALLGSPALGALQVSVEPERVPPVALGDARVWNAYVTVTVARDGRPGDGASVELRSPAGTLALGRTDGAGRVVLPVLSREPVSVEVWVDGADSGRRVEMAAAGPGGPTPSPAASPGAASPGPAGLGVWVLGAAVLGIGTLMAVFTLKKRFKRGN